MRRICEELNRIDKKYQIFRLKDIQLPLEQYPQYVMILFLDILQTRDDLIYGLCVLEEFERNGVKLIPPLKGMYYSDKFSNFLLWNKYFKEKFLMPDTICSINPKMIGDFFKKYGRILFKPIAGSMGIGIEVIETENRLKKLQDEFHALFLQQIIQDRGYDLRTFIIGDRVVAQYARYNPNQLLKNIHLGAESKSLQEMQKIDPKILDFAKISEKIALEISKIAELDIIGVDTLPSKDGQVYLIEWNSVPGFRGAEEATQLNIAGEIISYYFNK